MLLKATTHRASVGHCCIELALGGREKDKNRERERKKREERERGKIERKEGGNMQL